MGSNGQGRLTVVNVEVVEGVERRERWAVMDKEDLRWSM